MSTDIQPTTGTDLVMPPAAVWDGTADAAIARLESWASAASAVSRLVAPLVLTPFVPDAYRPKVDPRASAEEKQAAREVAIASACAAVLYGASLGFDPMVSLQQIYIIKARPGMYARAKVALLVSHGHEVWTAELDDEHAVVCGRRRGSDRVERIEITMAQARKAGWTSNDNYAKTPQDMLWARAAGRACDRTAPDLLLGIGTVEDLADLDEPIRVQAAAGPAEPTPADIIAQAAADPAPPPAAPEPEHVDVPPSEAALKRMFAKLRAAGIIDRDEALAWVSDTIDRDISSRGELTAAEVRTVCDALDALQEQKEPAPPGEQPGGRLDDQLVDDGDEWSPVADVPEAGA